MPTQNIERPVSFFCPETEWIDSPHEFTKDPGSVLGYPFYTTNCKICGEIPTCGRCNYIPRKQNAGSGIEYFCECSICGRRETADPGEHKHLDYCIRLDAAFELAKTNQSLPKVTFAGRLTPKKAKPQRLYRIQITKYPVDAVGVMTTEGHQFLRSSWKPAGWVEYLDVQAETGVRWAVDAVSNGYEFFWPSETKTFKTREAAENKAMAAERWGAEAIVVEAKVGEWEEVSTANARRKRERDQERIEALKAKIRSIDPGAV